MLFCILIMNTICYIIRSDADGAWPASESNRITFRYIYDGKSEAGHAQHPAA